MHITGQAAGSHNSKEQSYRLIPNSNLFNPQWPPPSGVHTHTHTDAASMWKAGEETDPLWWLSILFPGLFCFCPTHGQLRARDDRRAVECRDGLALSQGHGLIMRPWTIRCTDWKNTAALCLFFYKLGVFLSRQFASHYEPHLFLLSLYIAHKPPTLIMAGASLKTSSNREHN